MRLIDHREISRIHRYCLCYEIAYDSGIVLVIENCQNQIFFVWVFISGNYRLLKLFKKQSISSSIANIN